MAFVAKTLPVCRVSTAFVAEALPVCRVSTAFVAKTLPVCRVSTAFVAKTLPVCRVSTAFVAEALPVPRICTGASWLTRRCRALRFPRCPFDGCGHRQPGPADPETDPAMTWCVFCPKPTRMECPAPHSFPLTHPARDAPQRPGGGTFFDRFSCAAHPLK